MKTTIFFLLSTIALAYTATEQMQKDFNEKYKTPQQNIQIKTNADLNSAKEFKELNANMPKIQIELPKPNLQTEDLKQKLYNQTVDKQVKDIQNEIVYDEKYKLPEKKQIQKILSYNKVKKEYNPITPSTKFLEHDEVIYIVISSSMPKQTILNYYNSLKNYTSEVSFVLRGIIGDDISKIKPTLDYIKELQSSIQSKGLFQVLINPIITQELNIKQTPAVVFLQHYNGHLDNIAEDDNKTKAYIAYGDTTFTNALKQINKDAKSNSLDILIYSLEHNDYYFKGAN